MGSNTLLCLALLVLCAVLVEGGGRRSSGPPRRPPGGQRGSREGDEERPQGSRKGGRRGPGGDRDDRRRRGGATVCRFEDVANNIINDTGCPTEYYDCGNSVELSLNGDVVYRIAYCVINSTAFLAAVECDEDQTCGTFLVGGNDVILPVDENGKFTAEDAQGFRPPKQSSEEEEEEEENGGDNEENPPAGGEGGPI